MDHPYLTKRHELEGAAKGLSLLDDLACLSGISAADHAKLVARREVEMEDPLAREAAARRAPRMGLLLEDLALCHDGVPILGQAEWTRFLTDASSPGFGDEAKASLDAMRLALQGQRAKAKVVEEDGGSTSYSDYSDSHTSSSDEERRQGRGRCKDSRHEDDDSEEGSEDYGSEENESEDESEDEDDESPSPPVKRRR